MQPSGPAERDRVPFLDLARSVSEIRDELDAAMARVLDRGSFVLGAELDEFEREWAEFCGTACCIGVGNGLQALEILLRAHEIGDGDEVIVPAQTFIATWLAVSATGARPVPVAIEPSTGNLDPGALEGARTPRTRAVIGVHLYGQPCDMTAVGDFATRHGLLAFEDAAQAHGARWRGRRVGGLADGAAFSFYPTKNLGALGDGGAITCDDPALAERCRLLRNYGSRERYRHELRGGNSRLDEIHAAALRVGLRHLESRTARRAAIAGRYHEELRGVSPPRVVDGADPVWHLYVIRHPERDRLRAGLARLGVDSLIHYPQPPHASEAYASLAVDPEMVAAARSHASEVLSLPMAPDLSDRQVERVIAAVNEAASGRPRGEAVRDASRSTTG